MGLEPPGAYRLDAEGAVVTSQGGKPAILHQYDRVAGIREAVEARYAA
jgi:hypothetical protein